MEYLVVAFRSRSQTIKFNEFLGKNGVFSEVVNTPKEAGVGCGLSVKVYLQNLHVVKRAVKITNLNSFAGFFLVKKVGGKVVVKSI